MPFVNHVIAVLILRACFVPAVSCMKLELYVAMQDHCGDLNTSEQSEYRNENMKIHLRLGHEDQNSFEIRM